MDCIRRALHSIEQAHGSWYTQHCQALLERQLGVSKAMLTSSCTRALELGAVLLDIGAGDEVIVPSFTFPSTASAFALRGARPVFGDIRPDTLNLDERRLDQWITPRTRAIVVVHYAGVGCEMDAILSIARDYNLRLIEDNALGLFATYRGGYLGSFGDLAALSFHETKNVSSGDGGALLINDPRLLARAEVLCDNGTDRASFLRGEVDKYSWVDLGSTFHLSEVLAALLYAQLEIHAEIQAARKAIWERYERGLHAWAAAEGVQLPVVPEYCEQSYHMFYLLLPDATAREAFIAHLRERGIQSVFHYVPLHLSRMGQVFGASPGDCPVTEDVSQRLVRLPFYTDLVEAEQQQVIDAVRAFSA